MSNEENHEIEELKNKINKIDYIKFDNEYKGQIIKSQKKYFIEKESNGEFKINITY